MKLTITASSVKEWFQYRCERKLIYSGLPKDEFKALQIEESRPGESWRDFGNDFEERVIDHLVAADFGGVRRPRHEQYLTAQASLAFFRRQSPEKYGHQLQVSETPTARRDLSLADDVSLRRGYMDLVRVDEDGETPPIFTIIDVKSTQVATLFHKTQVAFYALVLRALLAEHGIPGKIGTVGEIWHQPPTGSSDELWVATKFPLQSYEAVVREFLRRDLRQAASRSVRPGRDDSRFHVYFKCEQCKFSTHCQKAVDIDLPPTKMDVSAIAGMTHAAKQSLRERGLRTVQDVARANPSDWSKGATSWRLRASGADYVERAQALASRSLRRLPEKVSLQMPPRVDVGIYLVADRDPIDGRLSTLGCRIVEDAGETTTRVTLHRSFEDERAGLVTILGTVAQALAKTDEENARLEERGEEGKILHIFVYEPAEALDIAKALSVHLDEPQVRRGLRELIRIFPPEEMPKEDDFVLAEPEYRGFQHLPASSLRSVFQATHAVPARVSYDLYRISEALARVGHPLSPSYTPNPDFQLDFSSRLPIDRCRDLLETHKHDDAIRQNVEQRLQSSQALAEWLVKQNEATPPEERFLRLRKGPFRFQATIDPLSDDSVDILLAQTLLASRAGYLEHLTRLARPKEQRRDALYAATGLTVIKTGSEEEIEQRGSLWMRLAVPRESLECEIGSSSFGVILSDGSPDIVLDPETWSSFRVRVRSKSMGDYLDLGVPGRTWRSPRFQSVFQRLMNAGRTGFVLDMVPNETNANRAAAFLRTLSEAKL